MADGYAGNHRRKAQAARKRSGNRCEFCGRPNRTIGVNRRGEPWMLYLQGAHRDHDKANPNAAYLCLCPPCHQAYDRAYKEALKDLNQQVKAEMRVTPLAERDLPRQHAHLRTEEEAAWQASQKQGGQDAELYARALWCSVKRWWFEVQVARRCVARCRSAGVGSRGLQDLLAFCKEKHQHYQAALARYQRAVGADLALQVKEAARQEAK